MINSVPKTSLAGTFFMEIDAPGDDANVEITDFGRLEYEFDLVPTQTTGARVSGIPGAMTVKVWDQMSNRGSFYDSMEEYIGVYQNTNDVTFPRANVNVVWTARSDGSQYKFPFSVAFGDIGIDERSQTTSIKLQPRTTNINVGTWGVDRAPLYLTNQVPYYYAQLSRLENIDNCHIAGVAIYDIIGTLDTNPTVTNIYETAKNIGTVQATGYYGTAIAGFSAFPLLAEAASYGNGSPVPTFMFNGATSTVYDPNVQMIDIVKKYASMEGAIFGSAFGVNFYMNRTINTHNVELSNVEMEELKFVSVPRAYNTVAYSMVRDNIVLDGIGFSNVNVFFDAWRDAPQQQEFKFTNFDPFLVIACMEFDGGVNFPYSYINNTAAIQSNYTIANVYQDSLLASSFRAFAPALGITATNRSALRIEATILGADKVRPYEVIKFDNTVPIRYQGKHFRPTSLSYDLKADKVKVTAYQIDTYPFDAGGNVEINLCEIEPFMVDGYTWEGLSEEQMCENGVNSATSYTWEGVEQENVCEEGNDMAIGSGGNQAESYFTDTAISNV